MQNTLVQCRDAHAHPFGNKKDLDKPPQREVTPSTSLTPPVTPSTRRGSSVIFFLFKAGERNRCLMGSKVTMQTFLIQTGVKMSFFPPSGSNFLFVVRNFSFSVSLAWYNSSSRICRANSETQLPPLDPDGFFLLSLGLSSRYSSSYNLSLHSF